MIMDKNKLREMLEGKKMILKGLYSDLTNKPRVEREIARLEERIVRDQREVETLKHRMANGPDHIEQLKTEIRIINKQLEKLELVGDKVKKLERLVKLIQKVTNEPAN